MSHFMNATPFIIGNSNLREPQLEAYVKIHNYYSKEYTNRQTLVVLPTGTGKTGLMAIAPYGICKGKVLIITPQTIVRNSVMDELNPYNPVNFYLATEVFSLIGELPSIIEFDKTLSDDVLYMADIVVLNIHKLQERLDSSLLKRVPKDFFDMIIIDEAHHSEARTWVRTIEYFENAKRLKVTGTPFRSDGIEIEGEEIYSYSLGMAMANGYVKSLERFTYEPSEMKFTIKDMEGTFSLEEVRKLKDEEWISRSVALSIESNKSIVDKSVERLKIKRERTNNNPHKIVAVACSIEHAEQLKRLYTETGLRVAIVHSKMDKQDLEKAFNDIETHQVDVVVNVALLGEGYDHKFLSIAAIFRPYRSDLPYQQFIGRVLRSISVKDGYEISEEDNIAEVIHHKELNLDKLWEEYKKEVRKSKTIKEIKRQIKREKELKPTTPLDELDYGLTQESSEHLVHSDVFLKTELLQLRKERMEEDGKRIQELMDKYKIPLEVATELNKQINIAQNPESRRLLRPDLYEKDLRKQLYKKIVEEIVPSILDDFNLTVDGKEVTLIRDKFIERPNQRPYDNGDNNGVTLAKYFNVTLKRFINKPREDWMIEEFERAIKHTESIEKYIRSSLTTYLKRKEK